MTLLILIINIIFKVFSITKNNEKDFHIGKSFLLQYYLT